MKYLCASTVHRLALKNYDVILFETKPLGAAILDWCWIIGNGRQTLQKSWKASIINLS